MKTVIINAAVQPKGSTAYIVGKLAEKYNESEVIKLASLRFDPSYINTHTDDPGFSPEMVEEGLRGAMTSIYDSELIIFISPNYFSAVSGLAKLFLDRFYVFLNKSGRPKFETNKKFFFILTQGSANRSHGQPTVDWMKGFCNILGFKFYGVVVPSCSASSTDGARLKMDEITMSLSMFL